jgi:membrane dipeptidase
MFSVWADPSAFATTAYQRSLQMIDTFTVQLARNSTTFAQARTSAEIQYVTASGKFAGILGVEGGHSIENDISKLVALYQRGARYMTITWNNSTAWATSAADAQSATRGLSDFGRQVIRTMDSLGMIIDVSHVGIKTIEDILQVTTKPIIASHSGVRALRNHTRNLTDNQMTSIAQRGGVIGIVFYPWFLSASGTATIDSVIRHIDYVKNLVGIDYIAVGSDFDGIEVTPVGLEDVSRFPNLTMALLRRGYSSSDVKKLLGANYLRVFHAVCD